MFPMITGQQPLTGNSDADIVAGHLHQQPPLASSRVPELPPEVDDMIERCLAKAAADRFPSMTELVQAIEAAARAPRGAAAATMRIDPAKAGSGWSPPALDGA